MAETVIILAALGLAIIVCAALIYGAGWLIISTPLMRWLLYAVVVFLTLRVVLLPFDYVSIWWSGTYPDSPLAEEINARTEITLSTQIVPTRRSGKFTLLAQGSLTNNSDQVIESISIWCRVPKLGFGNSETVARKIAVTVQPRQTKSFSSEIVSDLTGIAKSGHVALQAPDQHFCRFDRVYAGEVP